MVMRFSTFLLLLSANLCQAVITQNHAILNSPLAEANPFDGGALGSCEVPTSEICSSISYAVPTSIARLAAIVDRHISTEVGFLEDVGATAACQNAFRTVLCKARFPRCEQQQQPPGGGGQYQQVVLNRQNCSVLSQACPSEISSVLLPFCENLAQKTFPTGGCRHSAELSREANFTFEFCSIRHSVTPWMFEYIRYTDENLNGLLYTDERCGKNFSTFMCNFVGTCSEDGERVSVINTHERCNTIVEW